MTPSWRVHRPLAREGTSNRKHQIRQHHDAFLPRRHRTPRREFSTSEGNSGVYFHQNCMLKPAVVGELTEKRRGKKYGRKPSGGGSGTPIFLHRRQWMACREFLLPGSETGLHWHQNFMPNPAVVGDLSHGDWKRNYRTIRTGGGSGVPKIPHRRRWAAPLLGDRGGGGSAAAERNIRVRDPLSRRWRGNGARPQREAAGAALLLCNGGEFERAAAAAPLSEAEGRGKPASRSVRWGHFWDLIGAS